MASGSTMGLGAIFATYLATAVGAITATGKYTMCMYMDMYEYTYISAYMYAYMRVHVRVSVHVYVYIHVHIRIHAERYLDVYSHIFLSCAKSQNLIPSKSS